MAERRRIAEGTLTALAGHGLSPTPENYRLWYAHLAGDSPDLSRRLDGLLVRDGDLSDELCAELHERLFGNGRQERLAQQGCRRLQDLAHGLLQQAEATGRDTARYGSALSEVQASLSPAGDDDGDGAAAMAPLLRAIVAETTAMQAHVGRLEQHVRESSEQIGTLQRDLLTAWREARTDGLTGLANRKQFDLVAKVAAAQGTRKDAPVTLLLADIDRFKRFNDQYGHQMGDNVLRLVAATLRQSVKGQDTVARFGGEEFAIVLPSTRLADALVLADRVRETVASRQIRVKNQGTTLGRVTLSIGAADYQPGEPLASWIARADKALYAAKDRGRNRVVALPAEPPDAPVLATAAA